MSKMTLSAYNYYFSSGFTAFANQSSSDADPCFMHYVTQFPNSGIANVQETAKYSIFEIANWFLSKETMTHKKLQKLCYYAQAWFYALKDFRLTDTTFEAWIHGPVSPVLYDKFKAFGYHTIKLAGDYNPRIDAEDEELLESVWQTYGDHTGNALEALSHSEPPWIEARMGYEPDERCNVPISVDTMKKYYASIYLGGDAL